MLQKQLMKYIWILLLIALVSCESKEHRFYRCASDRYIYVVLSYSNRSYDMHIDKNCTELKNSEGSIRKLKSEIGKWELDNYHACNKCITNDDFDKLKSQVIH